MSKLRIATLAILAVPLLLSGLVTAAWAIDTRSSNDVVIRNVKLAGATVGGADRDEIQDEVTELASTFAETPVVISAGDLELTTTADKLGLSVDVDDTVDSTVEIGERDKGPLAPVRWFLSLFRPRDAELSLNVDKNAALVELLRLEGDSRVFPEEPRIESTVEAVTLISGKIGTGLDLVDAIDQLPTEATVIDGEIRIDTEIVDTAPRIANDEVTELVEKANEATSEPFTVNFGDQSAEIDATLLRLGFSLSDPATEDLALKLDPELVKKVLEDSLEISANPTNVTFAINDGVPTPIAGQDATTCCGDDAPKNIVDALLAGEHSVTVEPTVITAEEGLEWAKDLGVKEVVGEFTTYHACCGSRVFNIHLISDTTRGVLIAPGDTWSVNDFVGRRTAAKGYKSAGVIQDGEFVDDYGGGISQYATTLFNAAFFGGLEIPQYKAHSIYISRYPFGREATLSYPSVDLKIHNNTPFGVVIWPTYTSTSITVRLYSTRFAIGDQTGQNKSSGCGYVETERTRLFIDGHTEEDYFTSSYDCDPPDH